MAVSDAKDSRMKLLHQYLEYIPMAHSTTERLQDGNLEQTPRSQVRTTD